MKRKIKLVTMPRIADIISNIIRCTNGKICPKKYTKFFYKIFKAHSEFVRTKWNFQFILKNTRWAQILFLHHSRNKFMTRDDIEFSSIFATNIFPHKSHRHHSDKNNLPRYSANFHRCTNWITWRYEKKCQNRKNIILKCKDKRTDRN